MKWTVQTSLEYGSIRGALEIPGPFPALNPIRLFIGYLFNKQDKR